jgi:DNA mismatch repair protein MutL
MQESDNGGKIHLLDDKLIDKIAAGEVVENPSSVVKELIENSIDAGASSVEVEVREGGKSLIKVKDNGEGMSRQDAILSVRRHTTSKISSDEDLFAIQSLGFRGEALASICAVSEFSLLTKRRNDIKGSEIRIKKNDITSNDTGAEPGTVIKVENLFYNVPARKKFLKDMSTELSGIIDTVSRFCLAYNNISFKLISDGKTVLHTQKSKDELGSIFAIYGNETAKNMLRLNFEDEIIKINGFIGKPAIARNDRSRQTIYINGRFVKSKEIAGAIKDGYQSLLFLDKEPAYVVKL